ncbi:pyrroloquinoline quinone biosynthesis peptide chaperone PqqD [Pukyongiella litopenaei]|uniref:Pyrroloquinoline quinone biosynthesis peptide chaperone PqqD n=1 Tax=Pukyongiella litopenaei TaxID=2605946 RepID=A0A2S0MQS7_9RHOB|nr:pyrroloquinoline quinone biosynthesis peptide chaperone PqqD [Pukyongiella litopenaei]AVO38240.1 pyrroloquinoline quinone biosynthesis peptide chaperone PqqD [Pukyongiella litopenaei]
MKLELAASDRPYLPRGVRLHRDKVRGGMVLLVPEKAVRLDEIGVAILERVDGRASFREIVEHLAQVYRAPVGLITEDVQRFLTGLRGRMYLEVHE